VIPKTPVKFCLLAVCLIASACSLSGLDFNIDTASPQKTYLVKLEGRGQSLASTVQQVKLTVIKRAETILVEDKFYREETDHPFSKEFPVHEWLSDSVLRLGKERAGQNSSDKIVVINNGPDRVQVLKVEHASLGEKFLIFDFAPGATLELPVLRSSGNAEFPNPNVSYTVYANVQASQNMATEWRKTAAGSEILIVVK
jgi:hypothetical protein